MLNDAPLAGFWYVAGASGAFPKRELVPATLLGKSVVLGRGDDGVVFALRDFCPHRGVPLRYGAFDGREIECCYHGWCFNTRGVCTRILSFTDDNATDISRIKVTGYPVREVAGVIWIYLPVDDKRLPDPLPDLPELPVVPGGSFFHVDSIAFPCNIDQAAIGLMDPAHGPFVHRSWWWRTRRSVHEKSKTFRSHGLGFKMVSHKPSTNSRAYKILGGQPRTEIAFQLPGRRTEHIQFGANYVLLLTALTPTGDDATMLHQFVYSSRSLLTRLWPLLKPFGRAFLRQDLEIVRKQREGLEGDHPPLMLMGDADQQAVWYYKLKRDYRLAQSEGRPFVNSVPEKVLRWRS